MTTSSSKCRHRMIENLGWWEKRVERGGCGGESDSRNALRYQLHVKIWVQQRNRLHNLHIYIHNNIDKPHAYTSDKLDWWFYTSFDQMILQITQEKLDIPPPRDSENVSSFAVSSIPVKCWEIINNKQILVSPSETLSVHNTQGNKHALNLPHESR